MVNDMDIIVSVMTQVNKRPLAWMFVFVNHQANVQDSMQALKLVGFGKWSPSFEWY
jgi:hypothetical protein